MITKRNPIFRRVAWVGIATALLVSVPFAKAEEEKQQHQLNEKVGEALQKLKALQDTKNYAGMLDLVDGQLKNVGPTSYDACYLLDLKAKIYLQLDQYNKAIEPWEQALKLAQQFGYKEEKERLDMMKYLSQLIYSEATNIKDKAEQNRLVMASANYLKQYLQQTKKPEPEVQMLYAQILYYQATADEKHINQDMLKEARGIVEGGMLNAIRPKEGFYLLLLAILQQQNDLAKSTETMELLLSQYPNKKDIWPMLFVSYYNLAGGAKQESREQREYYIRAINTIERAQQLGFMITPRDNYNLFTLYVNAGEIDLATQLLYNGMKKGSIESNPQNWRVLGLYYQQENKELQAISALEEATKLFPKDGSLEYIIAQNYQQLERVKDAHDHFARAVAKGNLGEKPHQAYLYLAYTAFELNDYDGALKAINEAANMADGKKDPQVASLKKGIEDAIQDQKIQKERDAAAAKKM